MKHNWVPDEEKNSLAYYKYLTIGNFKRDLKLKNWKTALLIYGKMVLYQRRTNCQFLAYRR